MSNVIVMAFSPRNVVGCLLKKRLTKGGGGVTGTPGPPSLRPCILKVLYFGVPLESKTSQHLHIYTLPTDTVIYPIYVKILIILRALCSYF